MVVQAKGQIRINADLGRGLMVVQAKGQIQINVDLASGQVFDWTFDNLFALESRISAVRELYSCRLLAKERFGM